MNKKIGLFAFILTSFFISGCQTSSDKEKKTSSETTSSEVNVSGMTIASSEIDDTRKEEPESDVSKLRRKLYEAGINSSKLTDEMLKNYEKEAKEENKDFAEYVKEQVNQ